MRNTPFCIYKEFRVIRENYAFTRESNNAKNITFFPTKMSSMGFRIKQSKQTM